GRLNYTVYTVDEDDRYDQQNGEIVYHEESKGYRLYESDGYYSLEVPKVRRFGRMGGVRAWVQYLDEVQSSSSSGLSGLGPTGRRISDGPYPIDPATLDPIPLDQQAIELLTRHDLQNERFLTTAQLAALVPELNVRLAGSVRNISLEWCGKGRIPTRRPSSRR